MVTGCKAPITKAEKKEWLKRLRSGRYKQGVGSLTDVRNGKREYCCLGVLAALRVEPSELTGGNLYAHNLGIPKGACDAIPHMLPGTAQSELIGLNDVEKMPFELIADIIEHHPEIQP